MEEKDREAKRVEEKEEMRKEAEKTENMGKKPDRERKEWSLYSDRFYSCWELTTSYLARDVTVPGKDSQLLEFENGVGKE